MFTTSGMYLRSLLACLGLTTLSSCAGYLGFNISNAGLSLSFDILRDTPSQVTVQLDLPFSPVNPIYDFYLDYAPLSQGAACASGSPIVTSNTTKVIPNLLPGTDYEFALCTRHRKSKVTFKETKVERTPYEFDVVLSSGTVDHATFSNAVWNTPDVNGDGHVSIGFAVGTAVQLSALLSVNESRPSLHLFGVRGGGAKITEISGAGRFRISTGYNGPATYSIENLEFETFSNSANALELSGSNAAVERVENLILTTKGTSSMGLRTQSATISKIKNLVIRTGNDADGGNGSHGFSTLASKITTMDQLDVQVNGNDTTYAFSFGTGTEIGALSRVHAVSPLGFAISSAANITSFTDLSIDNSNGGVHLFGDRSIQELNGVFIDVNGTDPALSFSTTSSTRPRLVRGQEISIITRGAGQAGLQITDADNGSCGSSLCRVISGLTIVTLGANAPALTIDNVRHQQTLIENSHLETQGPGSYGLTCDSTSVANKVRLRLKNTVLRTTGANAHAVYMKDNCTLVDLENVTVRRGVADATATAFYFVDDTSNSSKPRVVSAQTQGLTVCSEGNFKWETSIPPQMGIMGNKIDEGSLGLVNAFTEYVLVDDPSPDVPWGAETIPFTGGAAADTFPLTISSYGVILGGECLP